MLVLTAVLRLILSFNIPWYFPEKSGNICLFFRHVSLTFIRFYCLTFFRELSFWAIQFVFVYLFVSLYSFIYSDIIIHLFIRIPIGLVLCLTFLSCLAIRYLFVYFCIIYSFVSLFICLILLSWLAIRYFYYLILIFQAV